MAESLETTQLPNKPMLQQVRIVVLFGGSHLFGQERANLEVMQTLRGSGAAVHFIINDRFGRTYVQPELERRGFNWTAAPFGYHWSRQMFGRELGHFFLNIYGVVATSWKLLGVIRKWKPTHIYTMSWSFFVFALPAIAVCNLPLVYRAGDVLPTHTAFHRWIARGLRRRVISLVCNSKFVARHFVELGFEPRVIYNHAPARSQLPDRNAALPIVNHLRSEGAAVLIYMGQVAEHKGAALLVETVIQLIQDGVNVALLVVGDSVWGDTLRQRLEGTVGSRGLNNRIRFLGLVENVGDLLGHADIHVCPSTCNDPSPNVIVEAKQAGIPSVAFAVGGIPELIHHEIDGFLCREVTKDSLAEGLKYFIEDPALRVAAGARARQSYETDYGLERFRREWERVFMM